MLLNQIIKLRWLYNTKLNITNLTNNKFNSYSINDKDILYLYRIY